MVLPDIKLHLLGVRVRNKCCVKAIFSVFDEYHKMFLRVFGKHLGAKFHSFLKWSLSFGKTTLIVVLGDKS